MERDENLKVSDRLKRIEDFLVKQHSLIYGDPTSSPPIRSYETRITEIEKWKEDQVGAKREIIKMAIGSITIALGGAIIWLFNILRDAFISKNH